MKKTAISLVLALAMVFSLVLVAAPVAEAAGHTDHCVCGGKAAGIGDHATCTTVTGWKDLNAYVKDAANMTADRGPSLATGNYYLSADLDLKDLGAIQIDKSNAVVTICLNGYTLTNTKADSSARAIYVRSLSENSTLNICDCKGAGVLTSTCNAQGAVIRTEKNAESNKTYSGTVNLYSGTIIGSKVESAGGTVRICRGTLNIYAAVLKDGEHTVANNSWGGNLMISDNATVNMYGGTIKDGKVKDGGKGANVYVSGGCDFNWYGGSVYGGTGTTDIGCATGARVLLKNVGSSCTMTAYGNLTLDETELTSDVTYTKDDAMGVYTITKAGWTRPADPVTPPPSTPGGSTTNPGTGDSANLVVMGLGLVLGVAGMACLLPKKQSV